MPVAPAPVSGDKQMTIASCVPITTMEAYNKNLQMYIVSSEGLMKGRQR